MFVQEEREGREREREGREREREGRERGGREREVREREREGDVRCESTAVCMSVYHNGCSLIKYGHVHTQ